MINDLLLQPFQIKHLTLKNRIMITSHEPAYSVGGLPTERYRLYHHERAMGGVSLTMTAGSAVLSRDCPPVFNNLSALKNEIVPKLVDSCQEYVTKVMSQLTHLGLRTSWSTGDCLPTVAQSSIRESAQRAYPKKSENWDIERIVSDYADAAERMHAAGLDGIERDAYGHFTDQFWSPATNDRNDEFGGSLDNRLNFNNRVLDANRERNASRFFVGIRRIADEQLEKGLSREEGPDICRKLVGRGQIEFLNVIRGHIDTDTALTDVIPVQGMAATPHRDFAGEVQEATRFPVFHAARINDVATARHAIASGRLDRVGMTRAQSADRPIIREIAEATEEGIRHCGCATCSLDRIYQAGEVLCIHNAATVREQSMPQDIRRSEGVLRKRRNRRRGTCRTRSGACCFGAWPQGQGTGGARCGVSL